MADALRVALVLCSWFALSAVLSVAAYVALVAGGMDESMAEGFARAFAVSVFFGLFTWDFVQ